MEVTKNLIQELRELLESTAYIITQPNSNKEAHANLINGIVKIEQLDNLLAVKKQGKPSLNYQVGADSTSVTDYELEKLHRKVPKWFERTDQKNSKILITFLEISETGQKVTADILKMKCSKINKFDGSYSQMKNFGEKNNGKVFEESNGEVKLWPPAERFILDLYEKFKNL